MPRYEDRIDTSSFSLFKKLKSSTSEDQIIDALAAIELLGDEANRLFDQGSEPYKRWQRGCKELSISVNEFLAKSRVFRVEAIDILEEFIEGFEHTENRFHQIIKQTWNWFSVILRFAIYALVLEYRTGSRRTQLV